MLKNLENAITPSVIKIPALLRFEGIPGLLIAQEKSAILKLRFLCLLFVVPKGRLELPPVYTD